MTIHLIDFNRLEVYEAGAMFVTWLAYPGDSEDEIRSRVHASLCNHALRVKCAIEPDWALVPQAIKPIYALRCQRDIKRDLRTLARRLRDRMVAGRMAMAFLKEALGGEVLKLPADLPPRLSINQMAHFVLDDTGHADSKNVETRIWRPSLPVIHLATAVQVWLQVAESEKRPLGLEMLLLSRQLIECLVRTAQRHESIIAQSRRRRIDLDRLIKVRLAEPG
jgi:hypothetical protein